MMAERLGPGAGPARWRSRKEMTNIVMVDRGGAAPRAATLVAACAAEGVRILARSAPRRVRLVTHLDVDRAGCERAVAVLTAAAKR
jgi:threonine aldolase